MNLIEWLEYLLVTPSATFQEQKLVTEIRDKFQKILPEMKILESKDSLILNLPWQTGKPHLALVGHSDTVPEWFLPRVEQDKIYGSGASDMKGALASYFYLLEKYGTQLTQNFNLSVILYAREEMTPLVQNGLYDLIQVFPDYFTSLDLAIVGEPTDLTLQIGCVGSIHARVTIPGQACHSARPWNGSNAIYNALPFIQKISEFKPRAQKIFSVEFFDILQITESQSEPGRTSLPGWWTANLNYRFAPVHSLTAAEAELLEWLLEAGALEENIQWLDSVDAGAVIQTPLFEKLIQTLDLKIKAKQAWTDVAQLSARGISALNFGPGLTSQAHQKNEYLLISDLETYTLSLENLLFNFRH
ncbi:succinyl-diaminopimelate desuccinylase [bacterium (Candidatus Blackallbacteria) CG17_big_fil_post_rev_8_21_14_2_50_48_46]|uniref:Succinyl-diaminopimelate desuccinylase n=1 Tax=bacterium (Candidatus Blackallbacteria) CG17_big_fil_post_rev_8_21_14_2_50_48_46 TaxID=2014261 RepID=A0A2M7G5M1_9BACT|nr:MAG: succinyl-diaminopimelate desuccinylase [bacterium (Candidatus Blackallbacteria) CG18_big_fil_WC_8_21_14_2_50_49_26]PIW17249.1 MAG: succinyl-diaminopimelate desuccinylase [bacterium (Candidatus Blackallbacteria) CG17_big_fil_post_rev_8_21_14_2_50_48_46]PIW51041.1 MAG: succinyl-diaminopimelate desuccinylase [bacterium (Candidatus Blackallbacteria) CG13_big_fil_rev_8_21_14_2_50_49_14]